MKIAICVPWVHSLSGNITAIDLANQLSKLGNEVDFIALEVFSGIVSEIRMRLRNCNFIFFRTLKTGKHGRMQYVQRQIFRDLGKELFDELCFSKYDFDCDVSPISK